MKKDRPPAPVVVHWHDAFADSEETQATNWNQVCLVLTAGWRIECPATHKDCTTVHIAGERFPDSLGYYRGVTHIPRDMIVKIKSYR